MIPVAVAPDIVLVQDARPVASETRSLPRPGVPPVIFTCPATSSFDQGATVPIPIFHQVLNIPVHASQLEPL